MNNKSVKVIGKLALSFLFVLVANFAFAINVADSDLSNNADSNQHWQNPFWFFVCVGFLIAAAVVGSRKKYIQIRRDFKGTK